MIKTSVRLSEFLCVYDQMFLRLSDFSSLRHIFRAFMFRRSVVHQTFHVLMSRLSCVLPCIQTKQTWMQDTPVVRSSWSGQIYLPAENSTCDILVNLVISDETHYIFITYLSRESNFNHSRSCKILAEYCKTKHAFITSNMPFVLQKWVAIKMMTIRRCIDIRNEKYAEETYSIQLQ